MTIAEGPERRCPIAEVSRLTGFRPTALRYYEDARRRPCDETCGCSASTATPRSLDSLFEVTG